MSTDAPELDTEARETPATGHEPHPGTAATATTWLLMGGLAAVVNVAVLAVAEAAGVEMQIDLGSMSFQVSWLVVLLATFAWLLAGVVGWALVAHRVPALAHLWVPLHWGMAIVAAGALVAVAGSVATAVTLVVMTLVANGVAAHLVPRRLDR